LSTSAGHPGNLEIVAFTLNAESEILELARQANPKCRLEIRASRFSSRNWPASSGVHRRPSRVEYKTWACNCGSGCHQCGRDVVWMKFRQTMLPVVRPNPDGPTDAGFHLRFHFAHRLILR